MYLWHGELTLMEERNIFFLGGMHLVNDLLPLFLVGSMPLPAGRQATCEPTRQYQHKLLCCSR